MLDSAEKLYERERDFNKQDSSMPPRFGVCFSGGGNRSASFSIGVLRGLYELGLLRKVDVMSAVSGGSYALSWFLLQPYYHCDSLDNPAEALDRILCQMFDPEGPFQRHLVKNAKPLGAVSWTDLIMVGGLALIFDLVAFNALRVLSLPLTIGSLAAKTANYINAQSMLRENYREGIQRTYHIFPDPEKKAPAKKRSSLKEHLVYPEHFDLTRSDVSAVLFPELTKFALSAGLPAFVFNATVRPPRPAGNTPTGSRIFELGPWGLGADSCGYIAWEDTEDFGWEPGKPIEKAWLWRRLRIGKSRDNSSAEVSPYATIRNFNVAPAISGAALSGTNIAKKNVRLLLRLLNMGLEYVVPSPVSRNRAVRLSDGGHSENLGLYALIRRQCRTMLVVDAEHDPFYRFESYRRLKRAAKDELGVTIDIPDLDKILDGTAEFDRTKPINIGSIIFDDHRKSKILYLKLSMHLDLLGDRAELIKAYAENHSKFPQDPTTDQYFDEAQFTAYRELGYAIARTLSPEFID